MALLFDQIQQIVRRARVLVGLRVRVDCLAASDSRGGGILALMYRQSVVTFSGAIEDLERAIGWLDGQGISMRTKRHATYLRTLEIINREWQARGDMRACDVPVEPKLMTTSAAEAFQLIRIWRAFAGREPKGLLPRLKVFAGGPVLESEEKPVKSGNSARDVGFELEVAAYFNGVGAVDLTGGVDVVVPFQGLTVFLECKRPSSEGMIAENLDRAADQLERELSKTRLASYGIPAISVAKAEWAGGVVLAASTIGQVLGSLHSWAARFDRQHLGPWFRKQTDRRLAAVLVHIPYEADLDDAPPTPSVQFFMIAGCSPGTAAHSDLLRLKTSLGVPE